MNIEYILNKLLSLKTESEVVEFKRAGRQFDKDKLGQYFSALSNEANLKNTKSAWLVMGIADDRTVVGTNISDKQINEYKEEISKHTSPRCTFTGVYRVRRNEKDILLFEIPATPKGQPMSWKGHRYGRDGESLGALSDFEYDEIKSQITSEDWSAQVIEDADITDLDPKAIEKARFEFTKKNQKLKDEIPTWSDEEFLNRAKITKNSKITNTAIVLLGKSISEHYLSPAVAKITWILKDKDNIEKDYEHFSCPLILAIDEVEKKIRNLKYRYIKDSLFPEEVDQYDNYIIREALNNCIAHQDYSLGGKIIVVENEDGYLSFANAGKFIPESVEKVVIKDIPEEKYRNPFLADAMVNLNMIDTIGHGIKKMFNIQRSKMFPLPDYDLSNDKVHVTITGKVVDLKFARKVALMPDLTLQEIIYLDKVAKQKEINDDEARVLRKKKLIEGRKPNYHISSEVAEFTEQKDDYMKLRGIENEYIQKIMIDYLTNFKKAVRSDFESVLLSKLSESLDLTQKKDKIKNNLQSLRRKGIIETDENRFWRLTNKKT